MQKTTLISLAVLVLIVAGVVIVMRMVASGAKTNPGYATLVSCMKDKGVKFYGAFWCPHCQEQEKWLGMSRPDLESAGLYIECSTADARGQTQICIDNKVASYPTWVFADGTTHQGEMSVADLSTKTGCTLPAPTTTQ